MFYFLLHLFLYYYYTLAFKPCLYTTIKICNDNLQENQSASWKRGNNTLIYTSIDVRAFF